MNENISFQLAVRTNADYLEITNFRDYSMHFLNSALNHNEIIFPFKIISGEASEETRSIIMMRYQQTHKKKKVDNASHHPNNHSTLFKRKVAPSSFKSTFYNRSEERKKGFWASSWRRKKAHNRRNNDPGIDVCKREKKLYMQARTSCGENVSCVWKL